MKKWWIIGWLIILFSFSVSAYGNARENYVQTLTETTINGKVVRLMHQNVVDGQTWCLDLVPPGVGNYPVFFSRQRQYVTVDGVEIPGASSEWYDQWDNWEHCPRLPNHPTGEFGVHNREHFLQVIGGFYEENGLLKIRVRNYGGDCAADTFNNCVNNDIGPYDHEVIQFNQNSAVQVPGPQECIPGSGYCCAPDGTFRDVTTVCASGMPQSEACSEGNPLCGTKTRYAHQYCSGQSAACNGQIVYTDWSQCGPTITINPERFDGLDNNCNQQIDEGLQIRTCMNFTVINGAPVCQEYQSAATCPFAPPEINGDGIDNNCNGLIDQDEYDIEYNSARCTALGFFWNSNNRCCGNDYFESQGPNGWENPELTCDFYDNDCDFAVDEDNICPPRCLDGTIGGACSITQPLFCTNPYPNSPNIYTLEHDAQMCGCPEGFLPTDNGFCRPDNPPLPQITGLSFSPSAALTSQSITFDLFLDDETEPLFTQLFYRRYELGTPQEEISDNPDDYTEALPLSFQYVDTNHYGTGGQINELFALADRYRAVLPAGVLQQGDYYFMAFVTDIANQEDENVLWNSAFRLTIVQPSSDQCTTIHESGNPDEKINIFYLRDVGFEDSDAEYFALTDIASQRLQEIPPIGTTPGLSDKFNFYRNNLLIELCEEIEEEFTHMTCNFNSVIAAALICNRPVKISNSLDFFSDKLVTITHTTDVGGQNALATSPQFSEIFYQVGAINYYGTAIVHELGHSFSLFHTHEYCTLENSFSHRCLNWSEQIDCYEHPARTTIMCYDSQNDPDEFRLSTNLINNRFGCYERWDLPADIDPPSIPFYCDDEFNSDSDYLIAHLSEIP